MKNFSSVFLRCSNIVPVCFFFLFITSVKPAFSQTNTPPTLMATGAQQYCPGTPLNIVTTFDVTDPDDASAAAIYVQISSGYVNGQDQLSLALPIPGIMAQWNAASAKLTLSGTGGQQVSYTALKNAIENVVYTNTSAAPVAGTRTFSITIGDANYLPSTGHYYRYISAPNISWTDARVAAENSTYYGLQGYLATLLTADEAQLCGEQTTGNGWIGGSDAASEGVWKWVTGPEAGITFWNGGVNGSTPNFAKWNNGEPNNLGNENYAHITSPGLGIAGSWNDLANGGSGGDYNAKGYIVEYGSMPGDPTLPDISASTTITIVRLISAAGAARCGDGTLSLTAVTANNTTIYWYDAPSGGNLIFTGSSFITPALTQTTTYYASAYPASCTTGPRTATTATINTLPVLVINPAAPICRDTAAVLTATASAGTINWYDVPTGGTPLGSGSTFTTANLTADTTFYADATGNGCPASEREQVTVTVLETPVSQDETVVFCQDQSATLSAGITDMEYLWSTGATSETIQVNQPGIYNVTITNAAGCSDNKTVVAATLPEADIRRVEVNMGNATVVMEDPIVTNYEYSLDNETFRTTNVFGNLSAGSYTVYVRSLNGCGRDTRNFTINLIPKFFTPNGDGVNDRFTIASFSTYPEAVVYIFDRYGKLLVFLNRLNPYWDGTFNNTALPATDYWYVVKLTPSGEEISGHFSLVR